ncbi:hypothetical protein FIBSPDRAFT_970716 [Athelia psychrophila]|uniref:Uncharacterized protein n=1 Tax=Athelia psychrophila TaxID=1759441 RepID=A0A167SJP7_9AGAM|nr:hypothetical protein FIBSPDRAFT_970716 [Fibularhizoctonia sp. CBS 109695]
MQAHRRPNLRPNPNPRQRTPSPPALAPCHPTRSSRPAAALQLARSTDAGQPAACRSARARHPRVAAHCAVPAHAHSPTPRSPSSAAHSLAAARQLARRLFSPVQPKSERQPTGAPPVQPHTRRLTSRRTAPQASPCANSRVRSAPRRRPSSLPTDIIIVPQDESHLDTGLYDCPYWTKIRILNQLNAKL